MESLIQTLKKFFLTSKPKQPTINHQHKGSFMTKTIEKNYTAAQEARLAEFTVIDNDTALELAAEFGKDVRSVRAKAVRLGIYKGKERTSKTGGKIETKEEIVAEIAVMIGKNLDGLENAPKLVLQTLREKLSA